jgi:hypothetical protein
MEEVGAVGERCWTKDSSNGLLSYTTLEAYHSDEPGPFPCSTDIQSYQVLVSIDAMAHPVASCGGGTIGRGLTVSCRRPRITKAYAL